MAFTGWMLLFSGFWFGAQADLIPEPGFPLIRNYTVLDYDADAQNWAIAQDSSGIMYFGNNNGVLLFDGTQWDLLPIANHSMVTALAIDKAGTVYVGGAGEFGYLQPDPLGRPTYVSLSSSIEGDSRIFGKVWNIHCTSHGIYFRARERIFRFYGQQLEILPLLSHKRSAVFADAVIFNGRKYGLWVLDDKGVRLLPQTQEVLHPGRGAIVLPLSETKLLLAVRDFKLFTYDLSPFIENGSFRAEFDADVQGPVPWENDVEAYLLEKQLYTAAVLDDGFAFGTKSGGVVITDSEGRLSHIIDRNNGLFDHRIHAVHQDKHKNLWATLNNGLTQIEVNTPFTTFPSGNGSHEGVITVADYQNQLYLGAHNGLFVFDRKGHFQLIDQGPRGYWSFFGYKNRLLTSSHDIFEIHGTKVHKIDTGETKNRTTYCFGSSPRFPDHLFTGNRDGIRIFRTGPADQKPLEVTEDYFLPGLHEEIRRITPDEVGNLWLGTRLSGLIYLQFKGHDPRDFRMYRFGQAQGLTRLDHCKLAQTKQGWKIATRDGVYYFDPSIKRLEKPEDIRFLPDPAFARFANQIIHQLFEDSMGRIWVTTSEEMGYFSSTEKNTELTWHGKPFKRIGEGFLHVADDQSVWVDASMGLYRYNGGFQSVPAMPFQTLIRKVTANEKLLYGGFPKQGANTDHASVLNMSRDNIGGAVSFDYSAAFFVQSASNRFRYILEGYDRDWSDWTKETHTNYTNLGGGTYRFRVESKNLYDQRGSTATMDIVVPYPWYHTKIAYAMFALGLMGLLFIVIIATATFQKRRHERRRQYELKQQELQKFETLGRLAGGIAHDFNGILATIYGFTHHIEKATRELPGLSLPFEEIEKAGHRGKELVSQILAFSRGDKPREKLLNAGPELHKALDLAQVTLPPKVKLVRRIDLEAGWIKGDPTRLHQVVVNLFRNAVQALDGKPGTVEVGIDRPNEAKDSRRLRFWVRDTGVGMDEETRAHLFEPFYTKRRSGEGTGLGLWVVHGIINAMGAEISVTSQPGMGSLFEIIFPRHAEPTLEEVRSHELPQGKGQRVLWIDSAKQRLREGILLLRQLGYRASGALMDEVPLADLERQPQGHDLIVLGCDQEPFQSQDFLARIRELRPDIPVICCVTGKNPELPGFQAHLEGPLAPKPLAKALFDAFSINSPWNKGVIT